MSTVYIEQQVISSLQRLGGKSIYVNHITSQVTIHQPHSFTMEALPPKKTHFKRRRRHEARAPADVRWGVWPSTVKRSLNQHVCLFQVVQALLNSPKMHGVLEGSAVWLAVSSSTLHVLEHAVLGLVDGGPATMQRTLHILAAGGQEDMLTGDGTAHTSVRLSLQEAMFMVHALQHLTVYTMKTPGCVTALSAEVCVGVVFCWSVVYRSSHH